jgi:hypothetical protein
MDLEADMAEGRLQHRSQVLFVVDEQERLTSHANQGASQS